MIPAGNLNRSITIERATTTVDESGRVQESWTQIASTRAQLIQSGMEETRALGALSETVSLFRIRFRDGLTLAHRLRYRNQPYDIKEIKEIGFREVLELRCVARPISDGCDDPRAPNDPYVTVFST